MENASSENQQKRWVIYQRGKNEKKKIRCEEKKNIGSKHKTFLMFLLMFSLECFIFLIQCFTMLCFEDKKHCIARWKRRHLIHFYAFQCLNFSLHWIIVLYEKLILLLTRTLIFHEASDFFLPLFLLLKIANIRFDWKMNF